MSQSKATQLLIKRGEDLTPRIVKITDNVYTSVNHSVSTISMIEGENAIVLIDAGFDVDDCKVAFEEFRKITQKPIAAIVYTHGHPDHTMGTPAFLENGNNDDNKIQIWARDNFNAENKQFAMLGPIFAMRGARQGGFKLPVEKRINNGIAPIRFPKSGGFNAHAKAVPPNHTFSEDKLILKIDSIEIELHKAPGETSDQLFVWYKEKEVLFCGDNMYRSFPNLYAVRGTGYRDVREWIKSIESMMTLNPKAIVLGHTLPVMSREEGAEFMKNYRDAIQYVYDKSIEGMNKGLTIRELGEYVELPPHLAELDYLTEFYGNVAWSAKNIFTGHLGWFDGNSTNLMPLTLLEEAQRMAEMAGGKDSLLQRAKKALADNDPKWAAQLADYCLTLGLDAKLIKADAIEILAEQQITATGRNYMYTQVEELRA